jgi:hypothetical protein
MVYYYHYPYSGTTPCQYRDLIGPIPGPGDHSNYVPDSHLVILVSIVSEPTRNDVSRPRSIDPGAGTSSHADKSW